MNVVMFVVATAIATIQAKHKAKMLSLREMIEKSLLLSESLSATPFLNPNIFSKVYSTSDFLPKNTTEW